MQRTHLREEAELVDLGDDRVKYLAFERAKHNGIVLYREGGQPTALANASFAYFNNVCHCDDEAMLPGTATLHCIDELLPEEIPNVGPEVLRVKQELLG